MNPNEYQQQALETEKTPNFLKVEEHPTLGYPMSRVMHAVIGMQTEAGEFANQVKHHFIDGRPLDEVTLAEDCGDVLWYVALALDAIGWTLEQCMQLNLDKLQARYRPGMRAPREPVSPAPRTQEKQP